MAIAIKTKSPSNQQLVNIWLKVNERNMAWLSRKLGVSLPTVCNFMNGRRISRRILIRMAEFTKLPLRIPIPEIPKYCVKVNQESR